MPSSAVPEGSAGTSVTLLLLVLETGARFDVSKHVDQDGLRCVMSVRREDAERARQFVKQDGQLLEDDVPLHVRLKLTDVKVNPSHVASEIIAKILL